MPPEEQDFPSFPAHPRRFTAPPKPRMSSTSLTVGIMLILGLLLAGGVTIYQLQQKRAAELAPPAPAESPIKPQPSAATPAGPQANKPPKPTAPVVDPEPGVIAQSNAKTEDWDRVQQAYRTSAPELALVALADFLRNSPGSAFASTAHQQIDECLDRLWWVRLKGLCERRDALLKRVSDIDKQIATVRANSPVPERIAELESERQPFAKELAGIQNHLLELKYKDARTPDPYDEAQLTELRKSRDAAAFEEWKKKTANYVTKNRGKLPW